MKTLRSQGYEVLVMKTLYDILNAHPADYAERLKVAFRKAAMACHPDLNLHDPEAPAS